MDLRTDQLIAALASPPGRSARGIVRISGHRVQEVLKDWFAPEDPVEWMRNRTARTHHGQLELVEGQRSNIIPVQVLYWPNEKSYTGQPLIELHLPGSPCLIEAILGETFRRGVRPARPGEFTMRAFLAGKLDLLQAEAVLGVIDANDHHELKQALSQLAGGVSQQMTRLRHELLELLADLEAGLDFVDEDIEFVSRDEVIQRLNAACDCIDQIRQQAQERMQSRVRPKVVLAGLPNAGKSTLFNCLVESGAAIVSDERGTTRDFLVRTVNWDNFSFDLIDTAGWELESSGITASAQAQRHEQFLQADLVIWCTPLFMTDAEREVDDRLFEETKKLKPTTVRAGTKSDLAPSFKQADPSPHARTELSLSAVSSEGISRLKTWIQNHFGSEREHSSQWLGVTAARCRESLESAMLALRHAATAARSRATGDELIAIDLRDALEHLGAILGLIYTDDILDRIFSKFCIGK